MTIRWRANSNDPQILHSELTDSKDPGPGLRAAGAVAEIRRAPLAWQLSALTRALPVTWRVKLEANLYNSNIKQICF